MGVSELEEIFARHAALVGILDGSEREYRFHPVRRWRFDFAWPERKVALEVEGGTFVHGRHSRPAGMAKDMEKYNEAALLGWRVLRADKDMVRDGRALAVVQRALEAA